MTKEIKDFFWWFFVLGIIVLLLIGALLGVVRALNGTDTDCYSITDTRGRTYRSTTPPHGTPANPGIYYERDGEWGVVLAPAAVRVDRNCLRRKGVEVPPVSEEEDVP